MYPPTMPGLYGGLSTNDDDDEAMPERPALSAFSSSSSLWREVERLRAEIESKASALKVALDGKVVESKPILIVRDATMEDIRQLSQSWAQAHPRGMIIGLAGDSEIQTLDDEDLRRCGLRRIGGAAGGLSDYDEMLRSGS